jgi:hypothetical protein
MMSLLVLSVIPLLPPLYILFQLIFIDLVGRAAHSDDGGVIVSDTSTITTTTSVGAQLLVFLALGILGHVGTHRLIPNIKHYMLKRGICGKDLGRKGTMNENDDV